MWGERGWGVGDGERGPGLDSGLLLPALRPASSRCPQRRRQVGKVVLLKVEGEPGVINFAPRAL